MRHQSSLAVVPALALAALLATPAAARAQSDQPSAGLSWAGFQVEGSASVGYRATSVTGRDEMYRELFNLGNGPRLVDFNLFARAPQGKNLFADTFSISASGLGGDPFPTIQFTARKDQLYDLRVTWRQSDYFWDQSTATSPSGFNGLTTSHAWDTVRNMGSANFVLHATNDLRVGFEFYHSNRQGMNITTRTPDFFGSPSSWGTFARGNPYQIAAPLTENASRYVGTLDYTLRNWNFHYRVGYQTFLDAVSANNLTSPQQSINIDDPTTAFQLLTAGSYQDSRKLTTPVSEFSYEGRLEPKVTWRGGYTFYRYSGPASLDAAYNGSAASGSKYLPYTLSLNTRTDDTEPTHIVTQGITYDATGWMNVLVDYRYTNTAINATGTFESLFNSTLSTGVTTNQWREHRHQVEADLEFLPNEQLLIRAGVQYLHNDVQVLQDGVVDPTTTKTINTFWPIVSASYTPSSVFSIRGTFDAISNDTSYTAITPETNIGSHFVVRIHPIDQLSIEDTVDVRSSSLDATDYKNRIRNNSLVATYTLNDRFAVFGGLSYDSLYATGSVSFLRGTPPLNVTIVDQTIDRVWQAGFSGKATKRLGFSFAGNYVRTTGEGTITGEQPLYGPLSFPYATGTVYYEFPKLGRLSVDLERTYYIEALDPLNNFGARILMVRWTRSF